MQDTIQTMPRQGGKEEMMSYWTLHRAMMITLLCAVLLSMAPATAGAIGTATTVQPTSRTAGIAVPEDGAGREGRETQGLSIPLLMSGVILGGLLGFLSYRALQGWRRRQERQCDIDRLTAVSFVTTTTWQAYSGENVMSYFSQIVGLAVQNFLAGAAGLAVGIAVTRADTACRVRIAGAWGAPQPDNGRVHTAPQIPRASPPGSQPALC